MKKALIILLCLILIYKKSEILSLLLCYNFENKFKIMSGKFIIKEDNVKFPNNIFYFVDDKCFMSYNKNNDYLCSNYSLFWKKFKIYEFNHLQIEILIKYMVKKYLNLNHVLLFFSLIREFCEVENHFNK